MCGVWETMEARGFKDRNARLTHPTPQEINTSTGASFMVFYVLSRVTEFLLYILSELCIQQLTLFKIIGVACDKYNFKNYSRDVDLVIRINE